MQETTCMRWVASALTMVMMACPTVALAKRGVSLHLGTSGGYFSSPKASKQSCGSTTGDIGLLVGINDTSHLGLTLGAGAYLGHGDPTRSAALGFGWADLFYKHSFRATSRFQPFLRGGLAFSFPGDPLAGLAFQAPVGTEAFSLLFGAGADLYLGDRLYLSAELSDLLFSMWPDRFTADNQLKATVGLGFTF